MSTSRYDVFELGWEPLHVAAFNNDIDQVTSLLTKQPNHNPKARDGKTALHVAVAQASSSSKVDGAIIQLLLNHLPLSRCEQDNEGNTPLHIAVGSLVRTTRATSVLLSSSGVIHSPATSAQAKTSLETVLLLTQGEDAYRSVDANGQGGGYVGLDFFLAGLETQDLLGATPLLAACRAGNVAVVEHLLGIGANIAARDSEGRYALHVACESPCDEDAKRVCALLLTAGCDVDDAKWSRGLRPDEIAEQIGHKMTTRALVSERRTIGRARRASFKRAQVCVASGSVEGLMQVLKQESDGGVRLIQFPGGTRAATLLLDAMKHDVADVCRLLLERGAMLETTTRTGNNALHIAARSSSLKIMEWLQVEANFSLKMKEDLETTPPQPPPLPPPPYWLQVEGGGGDSGGGSGGGGGGGGGGGSSSSSSRS